MDQAITVYRSHATLWGVDVRTILQEADDEAGRGETSRRQAGLGCCDRLLLGTLPASDLGSSLVRSCAGGHSAVAAQLLEECRRRGDHRRRRHRKYYRRALLAAVTGTARRHVDCVEALLGAGAVGVDTPLRDGETALHLALRKPRSRAYVRLVRLLLEEGADADRPDAGGLSPIVALFRPPISRRPWLWGPAAAAEMDNDDEAQRRSLPRHRLHALAILARRCRGGGGGGGLRPEARHPATGETALHLAVRCRDPDAVAVLLGAGARAAARSHAGDTPLQLCCRDAAGWLAAGGRLRLVFGLLVDAGAGQGGHDGPGPGPGLGGGPYGGGGRMAGVRADGIRAAAGAARAVEVLVEMGLDWEDLSPVQIDGGWGWGGAEGAGMEEGLGRRTRRAAMVGAAVCLVKDAVRGREPGSMEHLERMLQRGLRPDQHLGQEGTVWDYAARRGGEGVLELLSRYIRDGI